MWSPRSNTSCTPHSRQSRISDQRQRRAERYRWLDSTHNAHWLFRRSWAKVQKLLETPKQNRLVRRGAVARASDIESRFLTFEARLFRKGGLLLFGRRRQRDVLLVRIGAESLEGHRWPDHPTRAIRAAMHLDSAAIRASTSKIPLHESKWHSSRRTNSQIIHSFETWKILLVKEFKINRTWFIKPGSYLHASRKWKCLAFYWAMECPAFSLNNEMQRKLIYYKFQLAGRCALFTSMNQPIGTHLLHFSCVLRGSMNRA